MREYRREYRRFYIFKYMLLTCICGSSAIRACPPLSSERFRSSVQLWCQWIISAATRTRTCALSSKPPAQRCASSDPNSQERLSAHGVWEFMASCQTRVEGNRGGQRKRDGQAPWTEYLAELKNDGYVGEGECQELTSLSRTTRWPAKRQVAQLQYSTVCVRKTRIVLPVGDRYEVACIPGVFRNLRSRGCGRTYTQSSSRHRYAHARVSG